MSDETIGHVGVLEHALERSVGRGLVGGVDLVHRGVPREHGVEVGDGAGGHRHPQRRPVELALHGLEDERRGPGGAGRRRDDVDGRAPRPAQVAVRAVDQHLVAGVGVDGRHQALLDAEGVVEHLDQGHEAVGGARGVGDDLVLGGVEVLVVHAVDERGVGSLAGRRDDHQLGAGVEVGGRLVPVGEEAGGLDDHVHPEVTPRELLGIADGQHLQDVAVHGDAVIGGRDVVGQHAQHRVVLEQVRHGGQRAEVVHGHEVDVRPGLLGGPEEVAPDPTEAVDAYAYRHPRLLLALRVRSIRGGPYPGRSRCCTRSSTPRRRRRAATSSATVTLRCCPPVHPKAIVR